jgi:hypothetical protein
LTVDRLTVNAKIVTRDCNFSVDLWWLNMKWNYFEIITQIGWIHWFNLNRIIYFLLQLIL